MLQRKFILPLTFLIGINLLIKPFWVLVIERKIQLLVGESQYGLYFSLFSLSFILNVFLDFGIQIYNTRTISSQSAQPKDYFGQLAWIKFFLAIAYFIISIFIAYFIGFEREAIHLLLWVCANQFLLAFIAFFRSTIIAHQQNYLDAFFSVFDKLLMIILVLTFLHFKHTITIFQFAQIQFTALCISCTLGAFFVNEYLNISSVKPNIQSILHLLKSAFPYALLVLFMSIYQRIDGLMLERMLLNGAEQAGIYAASFRILDAASNMLILFGTTLLPLFSRHLLQKEVLIKICVLSTIIILAISGSLALLSWLFGIEIMSTMYGQSSREWAEPLRFLMIGLIGMCLVFVYGTLISASGKIKPLIFLVALGCLLSISLNTYLIPRYGATGAAISFALTQCSMGLGHMALGILFLRKN
ncbi:MAG: oligosaccharide flippase family protein [Chitinophagales bacterium]|nr:oligosaccharide flippase family protein [Chitinophagales bacterium]